MIDQVVNISDRNVLVTTEDEHTLTDEEIQYINEMIAYETDKIDSKENILGNNN